MLQPSNSLSCRVPIHVPLFFGGLTCSQNLVVSDRGLRSTEHGRQELLEVSEEDLLVVSVVVESFCGGQH